MILLKAESCSPSIPVALFYPNLVIARATSPADT